MQTSCFIDGKFVSAQSGRRFPVTNPASDAVVAQVADGGVADARAAVEAAARAFPAWKSMAAIERAKPLRKLAELMQRDVERLADLCSQECGKPLAEARVEVAYAASFLEWYAEEGKRVYGETIPASDPGKRLLVLRQPCGVAAAITPWNFPIAMVTRKMGPALAAGCTQVVKPAEQTPLSALAVAALAAEAGFPAGVLNVVPGMAAPAIAACFFDNLHVRHVSFTGSTEVGRILLRQSADNVVRVSLELGGHAPFIVFDDADLDAAVAGAMASKFRNAGQTCVCANRFLVQRGVHDAFVERLTAAVAALQVGDGRAAGTQVGPMIDDAGVAKVEAHVADAVAHGAQVRTGGARAHVPGGSSRFFAPTVLLGVTPSMRCFREETFGPVAPVCAFETEADALRMANDTPYGLAGYLYTRDGARIVRMAEELQYGIVGVNDALPATAQAPFGGVKHSGLGREGGHHGIEEYLDLRYVSWRVG
ncbi:MAG: NAD-dependent succinate-semialdehyde dehydrogenase [Planctomycetota bacterium]